LLPISGEEVDKIDFFAQKVRRLEKEIPATRSKILADPPCHAYFVIFNSQKDAAIAAQANIHPEDGNSFQIKEAPGPEEVCPRKFAENNLPFPHPQPHIPFPPNS
jgi:hypothetical protein